MSEVKYCTQVSEILPPALATDGCGALEPLTVMQFLKAAADKYTNEPALHYKENAEWKVHTWQGYYDYVVRIAKAIVFHGVDERSGICILGFNRPEWFCTNLAGIFANCISTGLYTTNNPATNVHMMNTSMAQIVFTDTADNASKILGLKEQCPTIKLIVQWDSEVKAEGVMSLHTFLKAAEDSQTATAALEERMKKQDAGACCELVFTSGTTGYPKAVMLSHDNLTWTARSLIASSLGTPIVTLTHTDSVVSFLPLSHVAAQIGDLYGAIAVGYQTIFAQPDALKGTLVATLKEKKPTLFLAVPRVYEKMMDKVKQALSLNAGIKKSLVDWARNLGVEGYKALEAGGSTPFGWSIAKMFVWSKVKANLGLDNTRFFFSSAGPLSPDCSEFFMSLGIYVQQIYGASETAGPISLSTMQRPGKFKYTTVGPCIDGSEVKLEADGELLVKGRNVFMGYLGEPKASEEALTDRWVHTGDMAAIDEQGNIKITGRKKEILKTAGGENVAPLPIERFFCEQLPFVSQAMVVGDQKKFLSLLLTIQCTMDDAGNPLDDLPASAMFVLSQHGLADLKTVEQVRRSVEAHKLIDAAVEKYNATVAVSHAAHVRKYLILEKDFSVPGGELTATMKVKKSAVLTKYTTQINEMYDPSQDPRLSTSSSL